MPSITTWTRIEPQSRSERLSGLAARVHDPLWLLTRQWQFGEWDGDDAGSPIFADLSADEVNVSSYVPGRVDNGATLAAWALPANTPLEALVEAEPTAPVGVPSNAPAIGIAARAGRDFLNLFPPNAAERTAWLTAFPLVGPAAADTWPNATLRAWRLLAGRVPNGRDIFAAFAGIPPANLPPLPDALALAAWQKLYEPDFASPATGLGSTWNSERQCYEFGVATEIDGNEVVLAANDYDGRALEWWAFDAVNANTTRPRGTTASSRFQSRTAPTPVSVPGLPVPRLWEFEPSNVSIAAVSADRTDIARLLFLEYFLVYGNEFFLIPHLQSVGSFCRTRSLVVTNTFGETLPISPIDGTLRLYVQTSDTQSTADLLFLPPSLPRHLAGTPIEEVRFTRDEIANIFWGVERTIASPTGDRVDRREFDRTPPSPPSAAPATPNGPGTLRYVLATPIPDCWIPFTVFPTSATNPGPLLQRAALVPPRGRLLLDTTTLREEEIPRGGVELVRRFQRTRWSSGETLTWLGRERSPGTGEGSSGLRFDAAEG
jgi:hypothetical protein